MAFVIADRVRETTTTTGTGSITLAGAYTGFQTFSAGIGNANNTYYTISSSSANEWEVGIGTYTSSGNTLSRDTVLASSNSNALVNFSAGTKDAFVTQPAARSLLVQSAGSGLFSPTAAFTANGAVYASSSTVLTTGTLPSTAGGTGLASYSINQVFYASSSSTMAQSGNLAFDGTTLYAANDIRVNSMYVGRAGGNVSSNTAMGVGVLAANTTGPGIAAFGYQTLTTNTTSGYLTAFGYQALYTYNRTADQNGFTTAVGNQAGYYLTNAQRVTLVGHNAGFYLSSGSDNTAIGSNALVGTTTPANNTGTYNTALGSFAMGNVVAGGNSTGSYNVAVGGKALYQNTTGVNNTVLGYDVFSFNSTGSNNVVIGYQSGWNLGTSSYNVFAGYQAGYAMTGGNYNVILGGYTGNTATLDMRTLSNYLVLSDGAGNARMWANSDGVFQLNASMMEKSGITATSATGLNTFYTSSTGLWLYTANSSGNFQLNLTQSASTTMNTGMAVGSSLTWAWGVTNGATAYYLTQFQIDGVAQTVKWQGGTAPSAGNANSVDWYVFTVIKTGASTYAVYGSQTKYA